MKKKLCLLITFLASICLFTACSDTGDVTQDSGTDSVNTSVSESETINSDIDSAVSDTVGVWAYNQELIYHASNNTRYLLKEDTNGTVKDAAGKLYSVQECDYRLYYIKESEDTLIVKEGRYDEKYLDNKECPDGYKPMVIQYKKSDLFDLSALERFVTGNEMQVTEQSSESDTTEEITETLSETVTKTETMVTETSTEKSVSDSETPAVDEQAEYADIYQDIENFLETDNFKQKDNGNRALELFNHLHNLSDANIEQDSIMNDTANNQIKFHCYEKYTMIINIEDSTIIVTED